MSKPARILWSILSVLIFVMLAGVLFAPPTVRQVLLIHGLLTTRPSTSCGAP